MFSGDADALNLLISHTKKPRKEALEELDAKVLKALGITVEGVGDRVTIKDTVSDFAKLAKRVLELANNTSRRAP